MPEQATLSRDRPTWRSVAIPTEHGGWGLTIEPVLLGLLVAFSWAGAAIGAAALVAFVVRTPLKVVAVDRRRHRSLPRTHLATRLAVIELVALIALASVALTQAGALWLIPIAIAVPFVAIELWFDVRSRSRRLIPELCGSVGIAAVSAAIVLSGDGGWSLAIAVWLILTARSIASIPFVRTQVARLHHRESSLGLSTALQLVGVAVAVIAVAVDTEVVVGATAVVVLAGLQTRWMRQREVPPAKVLGIRQMALGFTIVAATAIGVLAI